MGGATELPAKQAEELPGKRIKLACRATDEDYAAELEQSRPEVEQSQTLESLDSIESSEDSLFDENFVDENLMAIRQAQEINPHVRYAQDESDGEFCVIAIPMNQERFEAMVQLKIRQREEQEKRHWLLFMILLSLFFFYLALSNYYERCAYAEVDSSEEPTTVIAMDGCGNMYMMSNH